MNIRATKDNVIFEIEEKRKDLESLLVDTGEPDMILVGKVIATGPEVQMTFDISEEICAYKNRVAVLPWGTSTKTLYVVKEENIYGVKKD